MKKLKNHSLFFLMIGIAFLSSNKLFSHCEIPCGIYNDSLRIKLIYEDITTIEKSMNEIIHISGADKPNQNQLIRWVVNKEEHAKKLQEIVSQYFLFQRIKIKEPSDGEAYKKYQHQLELLHKILVYAMKCKQTTDLEYIKKLRSTVAEFVKVYFS